MDPTIQLILGVVTILLGGVVSGYVLYQLNTRRDARQLRRQKLEAAYEAFHGFALSLNVHWYPYMSVMSNKIEYNDALDIENKQQKDASKDLRTLEMLIAIYFPTFQPHLDELLQTRGIADQIIREHKERYREIGPHDAQKHLEGMRTVVGLLASVEDKFRATVRSEGKLLNKRIPGAAGT